MKNVSLRGLCLISVLALLSISQSIQAKSKEQKIAKAEESLAEANRSLAYCMRLCPSKQKWVCSSTYCAARQAEVSLLNKKLKWLKKK